MGQVVRLSGTKFVQGSQHRAYEYQGWAREPNIRQDAVLIRERRRRERRRHTIEVALISFAFGWAVHSWILG